MNYEFRELTVRGLKDLARFRGIRGYSRLRRVELIERLNNPTPFAEFGRLTVQGLKNLAWLRGITTGLSRLRKTSID